MGKNAVRLSENLSRQFILNKDTPFVITESYKTARTNLIFSIAANTNKTVVVTSCSPSDGKSTTCVNLAITLAQTGDKVLIIDADLRKPTIHSLLDIKNKNGLSSVLCGFCSVAEALNTGVRPNLDVICAGVIPPNPAELLGSDNMSELLKILHEYYDYILIDTPPVNVVSDSQLMNPSIAGMIFVVRENSTSHVDIAQALQSIKLANGKILGFMKVACNSKSKSGKYKSYRYRYYGDYSEKNDS